MNIEDESPLFLSIKYVPRIIIGIVNLGYMVTFFMILDVFFLENR